MVFGNRFNVNQLISSTPQDPSTRCARRTSVSLAEIVERAIRSEDTSANPALVDRVPAGATLYLPFYVSEFGSDVAFWRQPASPSYMAILDDFMRLAPGAEQWDDPAFASVPADFKRRFKETSTEEGAVMDTVLAYVMDQAYTSSRRTLLAEYKKSEKVRSLIEGGVLELDAVVMPRRTHKGGPSPSSAMAERCRSVNRFSPAA
jgi:hypothetical protein